MLDPVNRRDFLKAAAMAGPAAMTVRAANDKVNIGWIGVGTRGHAGIEWLHTAAPGDVVLSSICDTYQGYIARGIDRVRTIWGNAPTTHVDYRELLSDKDIDAVFIMTPEHLHHEMAIAALQAGKHVYLEKPLAHTIEEGWEIVKAWQKSGKIVQVGTQNRSSSLYKKAKELIDQGMIGDVHFVRAFWYRNATDDRSGVALRTSRRTPTRRTPTGTVSWAPRPKRHWDPQRYFQWRLYWDYSGGISTDLLVHQTDIVNFMLSKTVPRTCMASGGIYRWTARQPRRAGHLQRHLRISRQAADQLQLATSATSTTATASSCAATRAPSK